MARERRILWLVVTGWWTLYGLVSAAQMMSMEGAGGEVMASQRAIVLGLASGWLWIPFSMALLWCVERYPIERGRILHGIVANAAMVLVILVLRAAAVVVLNPWIGWYRVVPDFGQVLITSVQNNVLLLWMMVGVAHAWYYARREQQRRQQAEQLQARLLATRLDVLSAQLNPHFLFNALNSIAEIVYRDARAADRMLVGLGELLRSSLEHGHSPWVPLHEELRLLRHYLDIESQRLGDRLRVDWCVEAGIDAVPVPPLLLQPLAENAVVHAISTRIRPGRLRIEARVEGSRLRLAVEDDGGNGPSSAGHGSGLANIRSRLALLYGEDHGIDIATNAIGGTTVRLDLPLCPADAAPDLDRAA